MQKTPTAELLNWLRWFYIVIQIAFGVILVLDKSPDNRFTLAVLSLDFSNIGLGLLGILFALYIIYAKVPFRSLILYTHIPAIISIQRCVMIFFLPGRAKVAWVVYAMAWGSFILVSLWARKHDTAITTDA